MTRPAAALLVSISLWHIACRPSEVAGGEVFAPICVGQSPENEAVIVRLPDGALRIFYTLQPSGTEVRSITSVDGGLSWSDDRLEVTVPGKAVFCLQALVAADGELHAFVLVRRGNGRQLGIDLFLDVWHWRTTGGGTAWLPGRRIYEGVVGALRGVAQLRSGRIVLPIGMWLTGRTPSLPTGVHEVTAMYSDDGGETWQTSPSRLVAPCYEGFNGSNYGACEPNVVEMEENHLWMVMRTQTGFLYESHSRDGGTTWSDATPTDFYSSDSPAEVVGLPDDRVVILWNNSPNPPRVEGKLVAGGRDALHAAISSDHGRTWRGCREIYRDPRRNDVPPRRGDRGTSYATAVVRDDGKVVVATGQGENRRAILVFDPDWLLADHHEEDFSTGLEQWCTFTEYGDPEPPVFRARAPGARVVDHPTNSGARALHVRRPDGKPGDGAVWNFPAATAGTLELRVTLNEGFDGVNIALCDRFFNPSDTDGERLAVFGLPIDSSGRMLGHGPLQFGKSQLLRFDWDLANRQCVVSIDDAAAVTIPLLHPANQGISYLRIRSTAGACDEAGMLIEHVSMDRHR